MFCLANNKTMSVNRSILNRHFKSKKELESYVRELLHRNMNTTLNDGHDFNFLVELFMGHPTRTFDKEINRIGISTENYNKSPHVTLNGTDSISWLKCISGKEPPLRAKQCQAFRNEVYFQSLEHKILHPECSECKSTFQLEADHFDSEFKEIFEAFESTHVMPVKFKNSAITGYTLLLADEYKELRDEWVEFHRTRMTLVTLCKKCHLLKTFSK